MTTTTGGDDAAAQAGNREKLSSLAAAHGLKRASDLPPRPKPPAAADAVDGAAAPGGQPRPATAAPARERRLTGRLKIAAAELDLTWVFVVGTSERVPMALGDAAGCWPVRIGLTSVRGAMDSQADSWSPLWPVAVRFEACCASREAAERVKRAAEALLAKAYGRLRGAWLDCAPEAAAQAVRQAADDLHVELLDGDGYWSRIEARAADNDRLIGRMRR